MDFNICVFDIKRFAWPILAKNNVLLSFLGDWKEYRVDPPEQFTSEAGTSNIVHIHWYPYFFYKSLKDSYKKGSKVRSNFQKLTSIDSQNA